MSSFEPIQDPAASNADALLDEEQYDKLKRYFPELQEATVKEALLLASNNVELARATLQDRWYNDNTAATEKEVSIWSALFGDTSTSSATASTGGRSASYAARGGGDDWGLDALTNSFAHLGNSLIEGLDTVADAVGNLGDLIPDLIFGDEDYEDDEYYEDDEGGRRAGKGGEVVVGGKRRLKKRGGAGRAGDGKGEGTKVLASTDELSDESGDDWTKED